MQEFSHFSRWTDITGTSKSNNFLVPDTIKITTRDEEYQFGLFVGKASEVYALISQLADMVSLKS
jgi:hypothetical protein